MTSQRDFVRYRSMEDRDLPYVVTEHATHFPEGFFVRLGRRFLMEYYRAFLTSRAGRTLVAEVDSQPVGYLVGVTDPAAHREHVLQRHGRALALRAAGALALHPRLAARFFRTRLVRYVGKLLPTQRPSSGPAVATAGARTAVLSHVAVTDSAQSRGIGSELIHLFEGEVAEAGCGRVTLVTASGEGGAGPYYRKHGWQAVEEHSTPDGLDLVTFELAVPGSAPSNHHVEHGSEGTA